MTTLPQADPDHLTRSDKERASQLYSKIGNEFTGKEEVVMLPLLLTRQLTVKRSVSAAPITLRATELCFFKQTNKQTHPVNMV